MADSKQPSKEPSAADNAIDLKLNGNKFTVPIQGGIFGMATAFVFKAWITFNQMQTDVTTALESLDTMTESIQSMDEKLGTAVNASTTNAAAIAKLAAEVDALQEAAELCEDRSERLCDAATPGTCKR